MSKAVMKQALDALTSCTYDEDGFSLMPDNDDAIAALQAAIAEPDPGPTAWVDAHHFGPGGKGIYGWQDLPIGTKLYLHPPSDIEARRAAQAENELLKAAIARHQKELCLAKIQTWLPYDESDDLK